MRFSVEGRVENKLSIPWPISGLTMKRCAVAGERSASEFSICCAALEISRCFYVRGGCQHRGLSLTPTAPEVGRL